MRLDSNNGLAQSYLRLVLGYWDHSARSEEGKPFAGYLPATPEFKEVAFYSPVDPIPPGHTTSALFEL